eukprot:TRINITY_DN33144_c0_g1_i1.p2 TRINITY_DN33144_c0_g1~~TRINITY_DN33144_c0_g1_i1.p2  ORF type:complete len:158 (-),score=40.04 TRINITY_DN33144_c0_g1_i1:780-1253(-)
MRVPPWQQAPLPGQPPVVSPYFVMRRLYTGLTPSLLGVVPYMATKMATYTLWCDTIRARTGRPITAAMDQLVAGSCSLLAITVAYPMNLSRTKMQVQGVNGRSVLYRGVVDCLRQTVIHEGPAGLYRGYVPNALKALPAQSILLQVQRRVAEGLSTS